MRKKTTADFITQARGIHGDTYDYSEVVYQDAQKKVDIICPEHGLFSQNANLHLRGAGCPGCAQQLRRDRKGSSLSSFIKKSRQVHGDRFDYSVVDYVNARTTVTIICPVHGEFSQLPSSHVRGVVGCPGCHGQSPITRYEFISRSVELHGDVFDYGLVGDDLSHHRQVVLRCRRHDVEFRQEIGSHLRGYTGCPLCRTKLPLTVVRDVDDDLADVIRGMGVEVITNTRQVINGELDIYIPAKNTAVEFNGLYWHSEGRGVGKWDHHRKWSECRDAGVQLITVWEDDWRIRRDVVVSMIAHKLGLSSGDRVFARSCDVVTVPRSVAAAFLDDHHIQGSCSGLVYLGLMYDGYLVAVSVWKINGDTCYLERYATSGIVVGGMGKLLKAGWGAARDRGCTEIVTFADHQVSDGGLYEKLGFRRDRELEPDYRYVVDGVRVHKFGYREGLSESQLAQLNGMDRVWDCGKSRYVHDIP